MSCNGAKARRRKARRGVLTFEWILMVTLLVIGLIGGLAALRNVLLDQLYDLENAVEAMNFSGSGDAPDQAADGSTAANDSQTWWGSAQR
ncbi:MAG: hypothetical protein JXB10_02565 [Pirellulales bacterium]|nr:hypothetical protein [Pirellulales bacterium]